jgi:hypothetical protein
LLASYGGAIWDSRKVTSNESSYVLYTGPSLKAATAYDWAVTTWSSSPNATTGPCQSAPSAAATFITSLGHDATGGSLSWDKSAHFIALSQPKAAKATFGYFRKEVTVPSGVVSAVAFVTSTVDPFLFSGYKFYIDGTLVNIGPGRGEARVWGGDGLFRSMPYATLDVTAELSAAGTSVLALQAMESNAVLQPLVILQVVLRLQSGATVHLSTDDTWMGFDGDAHRVPVLHTSRHPSAGTAFIEYIDARKEPIGWTTKGFKTTADWAVATATTPTAAQLAMMAPKMQPPMQVVDTIEAVSIVPYTPGPPPAPHPPPNPTPRPTPPPSPAPPPATCVDIKENSKASLGCPAGQTIASVDFASFGM